MSQSSITNKVRTTIQRSRLSVRQEQIFNNAVSACLIDPIHSNCLDFSKWYQSHIKLIDPTNFKNLHIHPMTIQQLFPNPGKVILDLGFGDGEQLIQLAKHMPDHNFLGIELYKKGIAKLAEQLTILNITNIKIFYGDIKEILSKIAPSPWLNKIQIFFPDPWPKRRHHHRRLIQTQFIDSFKRHLVHNGILHIATDSACYANHITKTLANFPDFIKLDYAPLCFMPITKFAKIAKSLQHPIWELIFVLKSDLK